MMVSGTGSSTAARNAWTHPSVRRFAPEGDPIELVTSRAKTTVREAIQAGWTGPPFDPNELAQILRITTVPCEDVVEARIVAVGGHARIEFNPNRPAARVRFSIAHEIAHTLFSDYREEVRNRGSSAGTRSDSWQLELLCNLAASEFLMPTSFDIDPPPPVDTELLLRLQARFEISVEAVALRLARSSLAPFTVVVASRRTDTTEKPGYCVDYSVPTRSSTIIFDRGTRLESVAFSQCAAVGFTAEGSEQGRPGSARVAWDCVGVPPYPGTIFPRVVGIARPIGSASPSSKGVSKVFGDALIPRGPGHCFITQIVNDKTSTWGGGFSRSVSEKFPSAQEDFREWSRQSRRNLALGNIRISPVDVKFSIASLIAQHGYGPSETPRIRYLALEQCLEKLGKAAEATHASVQMPRIGTGYSGGNWSYISKVIDEQLVAKGIPVTVVAMPGTTENHISLGPRTTQLTLGE